MKYSKKQIQQAFKDWETELRLNPSEFKDIGDASKDDIDSDAKKSTKQLLSYIK